MRLEHVNLTVADLERSVTFYSRLFGWTVRWSGHTTSGMPAAHVGDADSYVALFEGVAREVPVDYEHVGFNHFGVVVDDLDAVKVRLAELDTPISFEPEYEPGRRVYVFDPDGHEVELIDYAVAS